MIYFTTECDFLSAQFLDFSMALGYFSETKLEYLAPLMKQIILLKKVRGVRERSDLKRVRKRREGEQVYFN